MATDAWVIFGAWATVGAAIATAVMAYLTRSVATSTREEAAETRRLAQQAQEDRELTWRPILGARWVREETMSEEVRIPGHWMITNVGSGPGLNCRVSAQPHRFSKDKDAWSLSGAVNVAAGGEAPAARVEHGLPIPAELFAHPEAADEASAATGKVIVALFCEDIFGTRYRFPNLDLGPDSARYPGERHRPDEEGCPPWVTSEILSWPRYKRS